MPGKRLPTEASNYHKPSKGNPKSKLHEPFVSYVEGDDTDLESDESISNSFLPTPKLKERSKRIMSSMDSLSGDEQLGAKSSILMRRFSNNTPVRILQLALEHKDNLVDQNASSNSQEGDLTSVTKTETRNQVKLKTRKKDNQKLDSQAAKISEPKVVEEQSSPQKTTLRGVKNVAKKAAGKSSPKRTVVSSDPLVTGSSSGANPQVSLAHPIELPTSRQTRSRETREEAIDVVSKNVKDVPYIETNLPGTKSTGGKRRGRKPASKTSKNVDEEAASKTNKKPPRAAKVNQEETTDDVSESVEDVPNTETNPPGSPNVGAKRRGRKPGSKAKKNVDDEAASRTLDKKTSHRAKVTSRRPRDQTLKSDITRKDESNKIQTTSPSKDASTNSFTSKLVVNFRETGREGTSASGFDDIDEELKNSTSSFRGFMTPSRYEIQLSPSDKATANLTEQNSDVISSSESDDEDAIFSTHFRTRRMLTPKNSLQCAAFQSTANNADMISSSPEAPHSTDTIFKQPLNLSIASRGTESISKQPLNLSKASSSMETISKQPLNLSKAALSTETVSNQPLNFSNSTASILRTPQRPSSLKVTTTPKGRQTVPIDKLASLASPTEENQIKSPHPKSPVRDKLSPIKETPTTSSKSILKGASITHTIPITSSQNSSAKLNSAARRGTHPLPSRTSVETTTLQNKPLSSRRKENSEVKESEETSAVKRKRSTNVTLTFSPNKRHRKSLKGPGQQSVFSGTDSSDNESGPIQVVVEKTTPTRLNTANNTTQTTSSEIDPVSHRVPHKMVSRYNAYLARRDDPLYATTLLSNKEYLVTWFHLQPSCVFSVRTYDLTTIMIISGNIEIKSDQFSSVISLGSNERLTELGVGHLCIITNTGETKAIFQITEILNYS